MMLLALFVLAGCGASPQVRGKIGAIEAVNGENSAAYARVTAPRPFSFPADHGPHPEYQTEWWYYTGNLDDASGRHFGFQLTFFRRALTPKPVERASDFAARNVYMAHLALSDVGGKQFYAYDRFSRDGAQLAGATGDPFRVWLEDWYVLGEGAEGMQMRLHAAQDDIVLDLNLGSTKPPTLQGDQGLSQKGEAAGNASLYYSLTRMQTSGTVTVKGQRFDVHGLSWMDREFGTAGVDPRLAGWDWFSIQLDDGRDVMFYGLRQVDGTLAPFSSGTVTAPDGSTQRIAREDIRIEVLDHWRSPRNGTEYPSHWRLSLPKQNIQLELQPYLADQELPLTITYWEGAVRVSGTTSGNGYVELTGYAATGNGDMPR